MFLDIRALPFKVESKIEVLLILTLGDNVLYEGTAGKVFKVCLVTRCNISLSPKASRITEYNIHTFQGFWSVISSVAFPPGGPMPWLCQL